MINGTTNIHRTYSLRNIFDLLLREFHRATRSASRASRAQLIKKTKSASRAPRAPLRKKILKSARSLRRALLCLSVLTYYLSRFCLVGLIRSSVSVRFFLSHFAVLLSDSALCCASRSLLTSRAV
jgi:hypothetical protein